jgi:hypothetical protein
MTPQKPRWASAYPVHWPSARSSTSTTSRRIDRLRAIWVGDINTENELIDTQ